MAIANYTHKSTLDGFNGGAYTAISGTNTGSYIIDNENTVPPHLPDTVNNLYVSDGNVSATGNDVYTGYALNGFPVMDSSGNGAGPFYVYHNGTIVDGGSGGTASSLAAFPLCFLKGTRILTANGEVAVENLQIGDQVVLDAITGRTEPVKFVFIDTFQHPFVVKYETYPICIKANAIADNIPCLDLYVSPDHALLVNGIFTNAFTLINGLSIYQVHSMPDKFEYYHIEMANHELVLAENVLAETFIDNVSRETFDNYAAYVALYPEEPCMQELDLPRAKAARQLPRAYKQALLERAQRLYPAIQAA